MKYLDFLAATAGERLFQFVVENILGKENHIEISALKILQSGGRIDEFNEYFCGILAFNFTARCVRKASAIKTNTPDEVLHHPQLITFFNRSLEIPTSEFGINLDKLATLTFEVVNASGKKISERTKRDVRRGSDTAECYICGTTVNHRPADGYDKMEYEHIWPSSYGGDSIVDNLLPACNSCNGKKDDMMLWQNSHVHSFVLSPDPSVDEWKRIKRTEKIAKHRSLIFDFACARHVTLKEAAVEIGPAQLLSLQSSEIDDPIDFFNFSFESRS